MIIPASSELDVFDKIEEDQQLIDHFLSQGRNPWPMCEEGFRFTNQGGCVMQELLIFPAPEPPEVTDLIIICPEGLVLSPSVCGSYEIPPPFVPPHTPDPPTGGEVPITDTLSLLLIAFAAHWLLAKVRRS